MPPDEKRSPQLGGRGAAVERNSSGSLAAAERYAEHALRIAWLRGNAHALFEAETSGEFGLLAAQLLDFADLLEVADARGWFQ